MSQGLARPVFLCQRISPKRIPSGFQIIGQFQMAGKDAILCFDFALQSRLAYIVYKCWPMSVRQIEQKIRQLIVLAEPTRTVCNMTEAGPKIKGCFPAEDIASSVDIEFEGKMYKTMVGYKDYLERTYGDYMTLPPVEQRVTHHFEAYMK